MAVNLTLVSNACMNLHPDNVTANFRAEFPRLLDFTGGKYEVALTCFQCKKSWNTFTDRESYKLSFQVTDVSSAEIIQTDFDVPFSELFSVQIPSGCYTSMSQVVKTISDLIKKEGYKDYVSFSFDTVSNKISVKFNDGLEIQYTARIILDPGLVRKLGWMRTGYFGPVAIIGNRGYEETAPYVGRLDEIEQLFISCDIAQNCHIVGDKETPILQIFSSKGNFQEMLSFEPKNLVWLPLRRNQFKDAMCIITDATGETVPFESGTSIVRVQIRRVSPF